jgi:hypothetical protein
MFRGLTSTIGHSRLQNGTIDPAFAARAFGVEVPGQPLRESEIPVKPLGDGPSKIQLDSKAPKPAPKPTLLAMAQVRLGSLRPQTDERKQEVAAMLALMVEHLGAADDLISTLEDEHVEAIETRREVIRKAGRKIVDGFPALQQAQVEAQMFANNAESEKVAAKSRLETLYEARKRISKWATAAEVAAADKKLAKAREEMTRASEVALHKQQLLAECENKVKEAEANLELLGTERERLDAELGGEAYFHPALGLSTSPVFYRDSW